MIIDKNEISCDKAIEHCMTDITDGSFKYITHIKLDKNEKKQFDRWLCKCEKMQQDYFFMHFETEREYNNLFGCSSFRIADISNCKAELIETKNKSDSELRDMLTVWIDFCDCCFVSQSILNELISADCKYQG